MRLTVRNVALLVMAVLCVSTAWAAKADKKRNEKKPETVKAKADRNAAAEQVEAKKQQAEKKMKGAGRQAQEEKAKAEKTGRGAKEKAAGKADRAKAGAKGRGQQAKAAAEKVTREQQKHMERQIRLERMLQVAQEKGDDKAVERIQLLIAKENSRYERKLEKTMRQQDRVGADVDAEADEEVETE